MEPIYPSGSLSHLDIGKVSKSCGLLINYLHSMEMQNNFMYHPAPSLVPLGTANERWNKE
jgi:hypothetical protein